MLTKEKVLKSIVECRNENGDTDYRDIIGKLQTDDLSLLPFLKELENQGLIMKTSECITVTGFGLSFYQELTPSSKAKKVIKKSFYNFSKFTFQRFIDILIGVIIGVAAAYIIYHFGWQ